LWDIVLRSLELLLALRKNEKPQVVLRLFAMLVALVVSAQPFADVVRNHTSYDRDQEP